MWSWTPVIDPGQGLSSFVQLTYNSQQRLSDLDLLNMGGGNFAANQSHMRDHRTTQLAFQEAPSPESPRTGPQGPS